MKIIICGAGALGSHVVYLARDLDCRLTVIDDDRVETGNLASQWYVKQMVGRFKAEALTLQCHNFFGMRLKHHPVRLTTLNVATLLGAADLVVDCFDNAASRQVIQDHIRQAATACLHGGLAADGAYGVVRWDDDFVIDSEDTPGQATCAGRGHLPIIMRTAAALVATIQFHLSENRRVNWNITPAGSERF